MGGGGGEGWATKATPFLLFLPHIGSLQTKVSSVKGQGRLLSPPKLEKLLLCPFIIKFKTRGLGETKECKGTLERKAQTAGAYLDFLSMKRA